MAQRHPFLIGLLAATLSMPFLNGCFGPDIPAAKPTTGRNPTVAETPNADETVRGEDDPPIVTLELGSALHEHRLSAGEELPADIIVPTTNLNAVPVTAALQAIFTGTDISLSWDTGTLGNRLVSVVNLSGPLPKVVNQICSSAKVFCNYRHGTLEMAEKDTFIVGLPPLARNASSLGGTAVAGSANSMVEAIDQLIGGKSQVDDQGGNIIYTTDVDGENKVGLYLEQLRNGRPLVVLQLYVWEVTLNAENGAGIQWNELRLSGIGPGFAKLALNAATNNNTFASSSGGISLGAVTTGRLNTQSLLTFLDTQGRVQTISNPQITFMSGSGATLKVGGKQRYISQVGQSTNNTSGTGTTANTSTNTINTDSIETGLTVDATGAYENGVVFANLALSLTNLVGLNPTTTNGITIDLPETTDEKITTTLRVRPGDNLVLAGIVRSSDTSSRQGIPLGSYNLPAYSDDQTQNNELVVVVKPSVVMFSDTAPAAKKTAEVPAQSSAILIDKDGAKTIALPAAAPSAIAPAVDAKPAGSSLPAQAGAMTQPVALVPESDATPVNRLMLQKGFSHAFDDLQKPVLSTSSTQVEYKQFG